jgi:hypothetical protein
MNSPSSKFSSDFRLHRSEFKRQVTCQNGTVRVCPDCQSELSFVCSWTFRDLWGYTEVRTYECPTHGPIFVGPQASVARGPHVAFSENGPDNADPHAPVVAPRKPTPTLNADAIATPEPE